MYKDKEKAREHAHKYYREHAEERCEKARVYYHKNKEKYKEYDLKWREKNAERVKELSRLKYEKRKNDPEYKERTRQYNKKHPEYAKRQLQYRKDKYHNDPAYRGCLKFYGYKRFDREKNLVPVDSSEYPTRDEYVRLFMQPCVFCGESDWHKIGLDRIDNSLGHVRGNLQPCCWSCNSKKKNMSIDEFRQKIADGRIKMKTDTDIAAVLSCTAVH